METKYNKLLNLIEDNNVAMLTTKQNDGLLKSRPMGISEINEDGSIWFFSNENSCKANEIEAHPQVNLNISNSKNQEFVSISGKASIHKDDKKMKELMSPMVKVWFPDGVDDPTLALIKVEMEEATYWINKNSKMTQLFELGKAWITNSEADLGERESFNL